jgi:septal ring factor EnvC (AmiA/AmiB activator)
MKEIVKDGVFRVCSADDLASLTELNGWKLVERYQESELQRCMEQESHPAAPLTPQQQSMGMTPFPQVASCERYKPVTVTKFLLRKDEESALAAMASERDYAKTCVSNERAEHEKTRSLLKKTSEERDAAIESGAGYQRMIKASNDRIDEQRATLRKYEEDIAKLRAAIGDLQFKEILGRVEKGTESR